MVKLHTLNSQAISHPIHQLPLELLEHIFHLVLELESEEETYESLWHDAFPLNLTQVCSHWESLVSSVHNRRLWSTVRIDPTDPDWLERLHLYLFLSRGEGLNIHITEMTQSIVDALSGHHRRIRSLLPGFAISQIWDSTSSEPDIFQVVITDRSGKKPFVIPLSGSVTVLPFVYLGEGSLHHLQPFLELQELQIRTQAPQLLELGGPLQLPALQRLLLLTHENPLDFLRIFAPSQLLDLQLELPGSLSAVAYYELETFIIRYMPNLRWVVLQVRDYVDSVFVQPPEESITQSSSARQSESLRQIDCRMLSPSEDKIPPFERLIENAPHLEECHLVTPIKSLPCFSHHIRKLEFHFGNSPISPVVNGGLFKLAHLEALKLTFTTAEHLQLLTLFQAPSLLFLEVSYKYGNHSQRHSIPLDAILTFTSISQGIRGMELDLGSSFGEMDLSLPELRNLKVWDIRHISLLTCFDLPKLQHLFLEIDDEDGEDESIAGGEDLAEDQIGIASPPRTFGAVGSSNVLVMANTRQILEVGNEDTRTIHEEDDNEAEMDRFKDMALRGAPSDPVVTRSPPFRVLKFEHLKDFEFGVFSVSDSHPLRVLPYFPDILTACPALERLTLPAVFSNNSPYVDQLVRKISENPTLCPNLQEIRTCDYPNDWSNFLKFLRDRKRASMLSSTALRPIHALHFPITPHTSIVEQLQDAMLGKVSIKSFPALSPWPLLMDSTFVHIASSRGEGLQVDSDEETRSQVQDGDERTAATCVQTQEEDIIGGGDKERQNEEESRCGEKQDEALSCSFCHKAGLGAGCRRLYWKQGILSRMEASSGDVWCSRWDEVMQRKTKFEVICLP